MKIANWLECLAFLLAAAGGNAYFFSLLPAWALPLVSLAAFGIYYLATSLARTGGCSSKQKRIYANNLWIVLLAPLLCLFQPGAFVVGALLTLVALVICVRSLKGDGYPRPRRKGSFSLLEGF